MTQPDGRCILPLPAAVVAQIKSSTAIASLTGVVLELLKNSLDARATKIEASVDFARGACTVEDDGLGIAPHDFTERGGLGKRYCTSKHEPREPLLGRHGAFLASLSAVSLLSVTSRHHQHRSHNTLTVHHASTIERQLPALAQHEIRSKHGTRVAVRNLFGNLPVRVKQRAKVLEHRAEGDRLWESLRCHVTGLLLSWARSVSVKIRDPDNRIVLSFNTSDPRPGQLASMLNVLTQASYISVDEWSSWVPASASTAAISVKGAISLDPAPTKAAQFISLGVRPLPAELEHNELYDHVNRFFALSTFGVVDENGEKQTDSSSSQHVTARKGVDRYPMFHLRIVLHGGLDSAVHQDQLAHDEANVQTILDVLGVMITQWLSAHHFRPVQPRRKRKQQSHPPTMLQNRNKVAPLANDMQLLQPHQIAADSAPSVVASLAPSDRGKPRAFAEWTRIKSGKASFYDDASKHLNPASRPRLQSFDRAQLHQERPHSAAVFESEPLARGALDLRTPQRLEDGLPGPGITNDGEEDATILWTDPITKKSHLLNSRTGCVMPSEASRPATEPPTFLSNLSRKSSIKSLRFQPTGPSGRTPWLDGVLSTWANPVFSIGEKRIQQISLEEDAVLQNTKHKKHQCSHVEIEKAFHGARTTGADRLSRHDLLNAEVVAQVDKKFILVRVPSSLYQGSTPELSDDFLVLIDQHAADERVQVETLFQELCTPITSNSYQSRLGHCAKVNSTLLDKPIQFVVSQQEIKLFDTFADNFARWGILYDILAPISQADKLKSLADEQNMLSVTSLPPTISERCKSDAQLLISLLRSTVWKYDSGTYRATNVPIVSDKTPSWAQRLASCPEGLVDMVNSRACRSAIMFNDELNLDQCKRLVTRLAACVFPFMCAHGRPSMVPIVALGQLGYKRNSSEHDRCEKSEDFVQAWKQWKR